MSALVAGCSSPTPVTYVREPATGAVYGPVHPAKQSTIYIGENKYHLIVAGPQDAETFRILTTHFPEYDYRGCNLQSAVDEMNKTIKANFPETEVQVILLADTFYAVQDRFNPIPQSYMPKITFSAREVPLMTVIDIVCKISEAHFDIRGKTITLKRNHVQHAIGGDSQ